PAGGAFVLTGSPDNTAKIWDSATGRELATLISVDSTDWVVTTPSGLFDASPGAMQLMHYVLGTEVIDLDQLKERYYEPGLLAKITGLSKGVLRDVAAFDQIALYPEISARIEKERLSVELNRRNGGIGKLSLFINGKEVQEDINPERQNKLDIDLRVYAKYYITNNTNLIALKAYNEEGWLRSQDYELKYRPVSTSLPGSSAKYQPHLFALMVGTSDYAGNGLDLRFADLDAEAMAKVITEVGGALFGEAFTTVRLLSTAGNTPWEMSTFPNINQAFQDIAAKAQPEDVLMIYFSGHGLAYGPAEKEQFYYLTKDISSADLSDPEIRKNYTVSSEDLTRWLTAISAQKQVMILDACNAGKVVESLTTLVQKTLDPSQIRALERMKDRTGMFILTGSAADKISYESNQYGQGLLTYSLLQGISGLALTSDKRVDVMTLFQYARDQVPILAKGIGGIQTPVVAFPYSGASFDIGLVTARTTLPSMQGKPVFIRSNFQDENFGDELGVANALAAYFQGISLKGSQADIIYVDVNEYQNGYSIRGRYTYNGNVVQVTGSLLKGDVSQGKFELSGKKNDLPGLVQLILDKVRPLIK
ncbi:MAG: caspase family protein, partial [Saprospiraceae bacterium]